jgi:hypothetical protein
MTRPAQLRRVLAWWAAALWILGFEVAPNVHLGLHGVIAVHSHGAAATEDRGHDHDHDHDHGHAHDEADDEPAPLGADATGRFVAKRADLQHGAHALLHRGIAIAVPPAAMPDVASAPLVDADLFVAPSDALVDGATVLSRARGPPSHDDFAVVSL